MFIILPYLINQWTVFLNVMFDKFLVIQLWVPFQPHCHFNHLTGSTMKSDVPKFTYYLEY